MNILITGASGFIGSHLSIYLARFYNIYKVSRENKNKISDRNTISVDLTLADYGKELPTSIDCVIHLAQSSKYRDFPKSSEDIYRVNIDSTFRLLEWARSNGIKHFIFASTASVYSQSLELQDEECLADPTSFYGATKLAAEQLAKQYRDYFQVDILRLYTVYGNGQKGMLIPSIIDRVKAGQEITLASGVGLYLTPIYIADVVSIVHKLVNSVSPYTTQVLNICGDNVVSLIQVVQYIETFLGIQARLRLTNDQPRFFTGNNRKLKNIVKNIKFTDIKDGLKLTLLECS